MKPATRKSFKQPVTGDKSKREANSGNRGEKKGTGGGGKGTWGHPLDDQKFYKKDEHAMDPKDPNYDPVDDAPYKLELLLPSNATQVKFAESIADLTRFKKKMRAAGKEYHSSYDSDEFARCLKELDMPIYHQDIPAILIRASLDQKPESRTKVIHLLNFLVKEELLTAFQMGQGFFKLYYSLDELLLDTPNAKTLLLEFIGAAHAAFVVEPKTAASIETAIAKLGDEETVSALKKKCKDILTEYFSNEELEDTVQSVQELDSDFFHFQVVKMLISSALDKKDKQREAASRLLAALTGKVITTEDVAHAFTVLLGRVEDTYLDVPDVLSLLSFFTARAVVDECLPPSFLVRVDLAQGDMGYHVVTYAQDLLKRAGAAELLAGVWVSEEPKVVEGA